MRINRKLAQAQLSDLTRSYMSHSDNCTKCGDEIDISLIHIPTGECNQCRKNRIKLDKHKLDEAAKLLREVSNAFTSKKLQRQIRNSKF
jgi:hypothetical protein